MDTLRELEVAGGTLEYFDEGRGRPLVLLHGLATNERLYRKVVPDLRRDFRCIVPRLPLGAHRVPMREHADVSPRGIVWMIAELLDVLNLEDAVVVGSDTGGALAQILVTERPERVGGLVLAPCEAFENALPWPVRHLRALAFVPGAGWLSAQLLRPARARRSPLGFGLLAKHGIDEAVTGEYAAALRAERGVRRDLARFLRAVRKRYTREAAQRLSGFERPALIAWAPEDRLFPPEHARRLAELLPDARLEWIEDSYTFVTEDQPEAFVALLGDFLARPASSSAWKPATSPAAAGASLPSPPSTA